MVPLFEQNIYAGTGAEYGLFTAGLLAGATVTNTEQFEGNCTGNIAVVIESAFIVGWSGYTYSQTNRTGYIGPIILYTARGINAAAIINCENFIPETQAYFESLKANLTALFSPSLLTGKTAPNLMDYYNNHVTNYN